MRRILAAATLLTLLAAHPAAASSDADQQATTEPEAEPALDPRVACLEMKESGGLNVANRQGSGAGGVLQYMESTFRRGAAEMGHPEWSRWEPWQARLVAQHDLAMGRRRQWTVSGC